MNKIIKEFANTNPQVKEEKRGFPNLGTRKDKKEYSSSVRKIEEAWDIYDCQLYTWANENKIVNLGNGNPLKYKPFKGALNNLYRKFKTNMYEYGAAAGDEEDREKIAQYLIKEGFNKELTYKNVIVTDSTTMAFSIIIRTIFNENDVILMTSPNYGLFTFMPERENINVEVVELREEDNYKINPKILKERIDEINKKLKKIYKDIKPQPRVRAFFNSNPHNPMGTVLNSKDISLMNQIGEICQENNMFIIDDLIYRDLTYDRSDLAKPMGTIDKYFDNTISLFGLSKSYGLAKARSGFVVANEVIIRALRDQIFYLMDSVSSVQTALMSGAYNPSKKRYKEYDRYFNKLIPKYIFNRDLCCALVNGIKSIVKTKNYRKVKKLLKKNLNQEDYEKIRTGIEDLKIVHNPESGFFMLIDFSNLKKYNVFRTEKDILELLYKKCSIKFLVGQSISWPNEKQNIIRISYSLDHDTLIESFNNINKVIMEVKNETNRNNNSRK